MKKLIILVLAVGALFTILALGMVFTAVKVCASDGYSQAPAESLQNPEALILSGELKDGVREIKVEAFKYGFKPDPIIVNKGEKVRLIATATDVQHGLAISGYDINAILQVGKDEVIEFVAEKSGEFNIRCSVYCGSGHSRMRGLLIVK